MDSRHEVFDISSDEECWGVVGGGGIAGVGDGYDWISELFEGEADDSDDVVLVGEVLNPKPRLKIAEKPPSVKEIEGCDDDDDCVVLDGDPDKPVAIKNDTAGDSDDLLIVGEKGQIACRDYPHPRHLCAMFPFNSTSHERHCDLCHCYVCDSVAPCVHWGNATSNMDHCHATDTHEYWKLQRRNLKQGDKTTLPVPKPPDTSVSTGSLPTIPLPPPPLLQPKYPAHHQVSRPTTIRPCTASANSGVPNTTNQGRSQQSLRVLSGDKFHPHSASQQLPSRHNNIFQRDRSHSVRSLGPQFTNSHAIFKRTGSAGLASTTNRSGYSSSRNNHATQNFRNLCPTAASSDKNCTRQRDFSSRMISANAHQASSLQNTGSRFGNSVPSHHQISSHPTRGSVFVDSVPSQPIVSSHLNTGNSFVNSMPYPQASSQPNMGSTLKNSVLSQPQVFSQPTTDGSYVNAVHSSLASSRPNMGSDFGNFVSSQPQVSSQPNAGSTFKNSVPSQPLEISQPSTDGSYVNAVPSSPGSSQPRNDFGDFVSSQPQVSSQPTMGTSFVGPEVSQHCQVFCQASPVSNDSHNDFQQGNEAQNPLDPSFPDFNASWADPNGQNNQPPLADNSHIQSVGPTYHPPFVTEFDPLIPVSTNVGSPDFHYDSWMLDNQPGSGALGVSVPSGFNVYSPELAPVDTSLFFDF